MSKIVVTEIGEVRSKSKQIIFFTIKLIEGTLLVGDTFSDEKDELKFIVEGVGLENKPFDSNSMLIQVKGLKIEKLEHYKDVEFFTNE